MGKPSCFVANSEKRFGWSLKAMIYFNTYLRTRRDIFKILFQHNWFSVWTDKVDLKAPNLKNKNIPINFNTQGPNILLYN